MSAFAVICQFTDSNALENPGAFDTVMERLSHRGSNGSNRISAGNLSMGYWHLWTTCEEVGEYQPLKVDGLPFWIVFDGRIDNRDELFAMLSISSAAGKKLSDATLSLYGYARWGEDYFQKIVGEFALVIFNEKLNEITAVRDHLGDRTLFYAFFGAQLVIASEPWAVVGASPSKPVINESAVAHYFAVKVSQEGQTFFKNVLELLPAHILKVNAAGHKTWRYWCPDPHKKIRYRNDEEYAGHFRFLLQESVRSRMHSPLSVGILMSGGLDSTSVACLAARMIAPESLTTISYVFDELSDCDERQYIAAVKEKYGIHSIQLPCDDLWTFRNWKNYPYNPNRPGGNLYRMVLERIYAGAHEHGVQVLLTGYMGDQLYSASGDWIADLIVDSWFAKAGQELLFQVKKMGWRRTLKTHHIRRTLWRVMDAICPDTRRLSHPTRLPAWINPDLTVFFTDHKSMHPTLERHGTLLSPETSSDIAYTFGNTNRYQVELRNPYRDRRLIEFVLAIPAYQLYCHSISKYILRSAMQDILPEIIRTRYTKTSLLPLYQRGVEREKEFLESRLNNQDAEWRKFLCPEWSSKMPYLVSSTGLEQVLPFLCISYETWHQAFVSEN